MARRGRPPNPGLTPTEERVLEHVRLGQTNAEIAVRLGISVNTVKYHVANLLSKAQASDRGELASWHPRETKQRSWSPPWWGFVAAALAGVGVVAGVALSSAGTDARQDPDLPPGYRSYSAEELEAMGMIDVGALFEADDGNPAFGIELRDAAAAVAVQEGTRIALALEPCCSYGAAAADILLRAEAPWGKLAVRVFTVDTGRVEFEAPNRGMRLRAPDGQPLAGVRVWNAGVGPIYGDATRDALPAAVDERGHLFVGKTPLPDDIPIDYLTGRALNLGEAETVTRRWPGHGGAVRLQASNMCGNDPVDSTCDTHGYMPLLAPAGGFLTCRPDGSFRLQADTFVLTFERGMNPPDMPRCVGERRTVEAGKEIDTLGWWHVSAETLDGQPLDIARSDDGTLYIGTNMAPDPTCPCQGTS